MPCPLLIFSQSDHLIQIFFLIQIHILNVKQCRSRSVGFFRSQLIWICMFAKTGLIRVQQDKVLKKKCIQVFSKAAFTLETWSGSIWFGSSWSGSNCVHISNQVDPHQVDPHQVAFTLWTKLIQINLICIMLIQIKFVFTLLLRSHCSNLIFISINLIWINLIWIKLAHSVNTTWSGSSWSASN